LGKQYLTVPQNTFYTIAIAYTLIFFYIVSCYKFFNIVPAALIGLAGVGIAELVKKNSAK
jgi:hypothetical protein